MGITEAAMVGALELAGVLLGDHLDEQEEKKAIFARIPFGSFHVADDGSVKFEEIEGAFFPLLNIAFMAEDRKKENLRAITMPSDDLPPRLAKGDVIVIDTADTKPKHFGVYAMKIGSKVRVLRLHRVAGSWLARQDAPLMAPEHEITEADIIGKVTHVFGEAQPPQFFTPEKRKW